MELFFGVLKSKGGEGLNFMFWPSLGIEFGCACVQSVELFISEQSALVVELENCGIRTQTSALVVLSNGILLVVGAVYIGLKLHKSSWFWHNSCLPTKIALVLSELLVVPAIPLGITAILAPTNDCFAMNRSVLDPLTIAVTAIPVICLVTA